MGNDFVITNDKFIDNTEKVVYQTQSKKKEKPYAEFCLTDKNLYIYEAESDNNYNLHIIKKSQITAVSVNTQKEARSINIYILLGMISIIVGIIVPLATSNYLCFIIAGVGALIIIIAYIVGRPKYRLIMSIYTPHPLNIAVENIFPDKLNKLQNEILKHIDNKESTAN